jgi:hypothetical protein
MTTNIEQYENIHPYKSHIFLLRHLFLYFQYEPYKLINKFILSRVWVIIDEVSDWRLDLLTSLHKTHDYN